MLNLFQHPSRHEEHTSMKQPGVYILASPRLGALYFGV